GCDTFFPLRVNSSRSFHALAATMSITTRNSGRTSRRRGFEWLGIILHRPGYQPALAGMANSSPARPAHRDVTGFGEFQQTLELRVPANRKPGASKGNPWTFTVGSGRRVR